MDWTQNRPKRNTTSTRQIGSDNKTRKTKKQKGLKVLPGSNTIPVKVYRKPVSTNRYTEKIAWKKQNKWVWTDEHTKYFINLKKLISQLPCLAHYKSNSEKFQTTDASPKRLGATLLQKQKDGILKPIGFASRFFSDTEKKYATNELELLAVVRGLELFRLYIYRKPVKLLTDHQALEPLIKRNISNKTYCVRLTRWLDRLAHFDIQIKHVAGKHLKLIDYFSRNPISNPEPIENYDEEWVFNCIVPFLEIIKNLGSITDKEKKHSANEPNELTSNE